MPQTRPARWGIRASGMVMQFVIALMLLAGCQGPSARSAVEQQDTHWPTTGWAVSTPEQQGMDPALLEKMQAAIREKKIPLHSLLIIRNGAVVSETYYAGYNQNTRHELFSVTKSFTSTLIGIALDQGKLTGIDRRVVDLLPGMTFENSDARKQAMTVQNILTMSAGLDWVERDSTFVKMVQSADWVQMMMDLPMATEPGKEFLYCSGCSHVLSGILQQVTGENPLKYAQENLFKPLGLAVNDWEADRQGIPIGGWGLYLTPREMAKLGYLYLHNGAWDGKQIVSARWVQEATKKRLDTGGRLGYGYQWWTYPTHNAYAALGRFGQTIFVAPDLDLIIVTTAHIVSGHDPIYDLIDNYILPAVKSPASTGD